MRDDLRVAYVLPSWPRLSKTFILNEILELERIGVTVAIYSLERSGESLVQAQVGDIEAPVRYLDAALTRSLLSHLRMFARSPRRYVTSLAYSRRRRLFGGYSEMARGGAFHAAVRLADGLTREAGSSKPFRRIHAHFAHDATLVGLLAHRLSGVSFSFTAHARDLYQISDRALAERARGASAVVTCCQANVQHIRRLVGDATPVVLIYHGVDLQRFAPATTQPSEGDPVILSVGRLVEELGFDDLLEACAVLAASRRRFRCEVFGEGPDRGRLESLRDRLGLKEMVEFRGARTHAELVPAFRRADVFALTPRRSENGAHSGVPNALLEAMASGKAAVATVTGGVREVLNDGVNGLLINDHSTASIAAGLAAVLDDAALRRRLGENAAQTAVNFDARNAALRLAELFSEETQRA